METHRLPYARDSAELFERLLEMPRPALLHSADRGHPEARHDVLVADPEHAIGWSPASCARADPLIRIRSLLPGAEGLADVPFQRGFVGYFGYPLHASMENTGRLPADPTHLPVVSGGIYRWSIVTDHLLRRTTLQLDPDLSPAYRRTLRERLTRHTVPQNLPAIAPGRFETELDDAGYLDAFRQVQRYIHDGDCYQINLARHYSAPYPTQRSHLRSSWSTYRQLLNVQPGAFSAFLGSPDGAVLCYSPERFIRFGTNRVETRPIKGTRPRCPETDQDEAARRDLLASDKDRAENLMIVDLMRNDLGRVCLSGSVRVERLFGLESMANVHHLVSTVAGRPAPGIGPLDALRAVFPGGSITGAPKIRATQIINELEPVGRSVFCGSVGYLDANGTMDTNIAIRTLVIDRERIHCWGGGGIVVDSDARQERAEIGYKIGALLQTLGCASASRS